MPPATSTSQPATKYTLHPDGSDWGAIPIPRAASKCTFGGADRRTLYVTAREGHDSVDLPMRGLRVVGLD